MKAVNLLPPDLRHADRRGAGASGAAGRRRTDAAPLAILGVLALVLVAVVATVFASNRIKSNERDLRNAQAEQVVADREVAALAPFGDFQELASKRVSTVRQLAAARFDWERALRDLSRAVPQDVTLDLIAGTVAPNTNATGASPNPLRQAIAAPAIELEGCTAGQLEVARLMARLRGVQGVTRVSLASSARQEDTLTTPTAGTTTKRAGCGKGSLPKFQIVIFFEKNAAVPGGSAAPATTPGTATPAAATTPATPAPSATPAPGAAATPAPGASPAATPTPAPAPGQQASTPSSSTTQGVSAP